MNTIQHTLAFVITCIFSTTAIAQIYSSKQITTNEMALLPNYCQYTQGSQYGISVGGNNHPQAVAWQNTIGPGFIHLHHYCWGLAELQRVVRRTTPGHQKKTLLNSAIGNFWYVIRNSPDDLILLPEIYTNIGKTELQLNQPEKANEAFSKARNAKNDYWPAYYHWAEYLYSKGKNKEALIIVSQGIEHSPNTNALIELKNKLTNKK